VTPLITHYQAFTPFFSITESNEIPLSVYKLTARVHFRGRQNTIFTPQQISDLYAVREIGLPIAPPITLLPPQLMIQPAEKLVPAPEKLAARLEGLGDIRSILGQRNAKHP
jgi:hypothetical protein